LYIAGKNVISNGVPSRPNGSSYPVLGDMKNSFEADGTKYALKGAWDLTRLGSLKLIVVGLFI
jgi:hypothetical protein